MADDIIIRKDVRSLSRNEKRKFVVAVKALKVTTPRTTNLAIKDI
jgi:hypothetical protein